MQKLPGGGIADVRSEIRQPTGDPATCFDDLVRIRKMNLCPVREPRRTKREFPAIDPRLVDREREEEIRFANHLVIEEIAGAGLEGVGVNRPPAKRDDDAELVFLVSLSGKRDKSAVACCAEFEERSGGRHQWRRLVKVAVEGAERPVQTGHGERGAEARTDSVLGKSGVAGEVRRPQARGTDSQENGLKLSSMKKAARPPVGSSALLNGG